jgi:hypothetical protein
MNITARQAFRPATRANHTAMFRTYISFCTYFQLQDIDPQPSTLCAYVQYLTRTFSSPLSIKNYMSTVNLLHLMNNRQPPAKTFAVTNMIRAIQLTMRHMPSQKLPITPEILNQLCDLCDQQHATGRLLKAAFMLLFFTFIRQSSLAPRNVNKFDITRHLTRADVFFAPPGYIILIKWTKTRQNGQHVSLPVPQIRHSHCPVRALRAAV